MAYVPGFIDRDFSLPEWVDYQKNVLEFEDTHNIEELLDNEQNLVGWKLKHK